MAQVKLNHTAEAINHKLDLIDENKNLLPYPYEPAIANYDVLEDVGDGSILTREKIDSTIEILLNHATLQAGKKYVISLNITDILENITAISGCELIILVNNVEQCRTTGTDDLDLSNESDEKAILVYLKIPAGADKGLLIKPQIEEYNEDTEMGVWVPYMKTIGNYVDERFNGTNAKIKALNKYLGLPDCSEYSDGYTLVVQDGAWAIDAASGNVTLSNGLIYILNDDRKSYRVISARIYESTEAVIQATYNGLPVTLIGWTAFSDCVKLTSVTIPDSVTNIDYQAFRNCTNLTSIDIPYNVSLGSQTFMDCTSLTSATVRSNITTGQFNGCTNLKSVKIYPVVTYIGSTAFYDCIGLTSVDIPDSVTRIDFDAFGGCNNLETINCAFAEGTVLGAPWGASNTTMINYNVQLQ